MTWGECVSVLVLLLVFTTSGADIPPCPTEDSPGPCVWNAQTQGNGQGRSFLVTEDGSVLFLKKG